MYNLTLQQKTILRQHCLNELLASTHKQQNAGQTFVIIAFDKKQYPYTISYKRRDAIREKVLKDSLRTLI
jgi:hypothetical protein